MIQSRFFSFLCALSATMLVFGCAQKITVAPRNADEYYEQALEAFNTENLAVAQRYFDAIKLQYPASKYADDAQYYLAEINVKKNENILAAYNYNQLRRTFPNSEYAKISAYKAAMSSMRQSPKFDRDQDYTKQAIKAFSEFQALYPKDSLTLEAGKQIRDLRTKLAEHDYRTAELYIKLNAPRASLTYYDLVLNNYPDTEFLEPSFLGRARMLVRLKRFQEAEEALRLYRQRFPQGKLQAEEKDVIDLLKQAQTTASSAQP
ncbi:MAG: outer membrane protein assembly factor BamD [Candidatus Kapaibacteriota bacterium]